MTQRDFDQWTNAWLIAIVFWSCIGLFALAHFNPSGKYYTAYHVDDQGCHVTDTLYFNFSLITYKNCSGIK